MTALFHHLDSAITLWLHPDRQGVSAVSFSDYQAALERRDALEIVRADWGAAYDGQSWLDWLWERSRPATGDELYGLELALDETRHSELPDFTVHEIGDLAMALAGDGWRVLDWSQIAHARDYLEACENERPANRGWEHPPTYELDPGHATEIALEGSRLATADEIAALARAIEESQR